MTPGPVDVDPRVLRAMSMPISGQYDPVFRELMGEIFEPAEVIAAIKEYQPKVLAMVHGETSTGQMQ